MVFEMNRTSIACFYFFVFKTGKFGDEFCCGFDLIWLLWVRLECRYFIWGAGP